MGDKFGFIDSKGNIIINPQFDGIVNEFQNTFQIEDGNYTLSDFIDCNSILKLISLKQEYSINNDNLRIRLGSLLKKYNLNFNTIPYHELYLNEINLFTQKQIGGNFTIDYSAKFSKTQDWDYSKIDQYGRPEIRAAYNEKPIELNLKINLIGIAYDKEEAILNRLVANIPFKLDSRSSNLNKIYNLNNDDVLIIRKNSSNQILVSISSKKYLSPNVYYYDVNNQGVNSSYESNLNDLSIAVDSAYVALPDSSR
jgi:hypothetical protein